MLWKHLQNVAHFVLASMFQWLTLAVRSLQRGHLPHSGGIQASLTLAHCHMYHCYQHMEASSIWHIFCRQHFQIPVSTFFLMKIILPVFWFKFQRISVEAVKDSTDTNVRDSTDTNVRDSTDTNVRDSTDTNVRDSTDTNVRDSTDTNVIYNEVKSHIQIYSAQLQFRQGSW